MAQSVGRRKAAQPVILAVSAREATQAGEPFYQGNAMVWLADRVPPQFLSLTVE